MFLLLNANGSRWWRFRYRFHGREKLLSLGVWPDVSLKKARERRGEARQLIADGIDPSLHRQSQKGAQANTFEAVGNEWLGLQQGKLAPATYKKAEWMLETFLYPKIGSTPITSIIAQQLLPILNGLNPGKRLIGCASVRPGVPVRHCHRPGRAGSGRGYQGRSGAGYFRSSSASWPMPNANKVRAAYYNRAEHLNERKKMMQAWADYLDGLKAGNKKVVALKAGKGKTA